MLKWVLSDRHSLLENLLHLSVIWTYRSNGYLLDPHFFSSISLPCPPFHDCSCLIPKFPQKRLGFLPFLLSSIVDFSTPYFYNHHVGGPLLETKAGIVDRLLPKDPLLHKSIKWKIKTETFLSIDSDWKDQNIQSCLILCKLLMNIYWWPPTPQTPHVVVCTRKQSHPCLETYVM